MSDNAKKITILALILLVAYLLWRKMKPTPVVTHRILSLSDPVKAIAYGPAIHQFVDGQWYWTAPQGYHVEVAGDGSYWVVETTPTRIGPQMIRDSGTTWSAWDGSAVPPQGAAGGGIGSSDILPNETLIAAFQGNTTGFSGPYTATGSLPGITMTPQDAAPDTNSNPDILAGTGAMPTWPGRSQTYIPYSPAFRTPTMDGEGYV